MKNRLIPCRACQRHVFATESHCPFCDIRLDDAPTPARPTARGRMSRAALFALGTSLVSTACGGQAVEQSSNTGNGNTSASSQSNSTSSSSGGATSSAGPTSSGSGNTSTTGNATTGGEQPVYGAPVYGAPATDTVTGIGGATGTGGIGAAGDTFVDNGAGGDLAIYGAPPAPRD